MKTEVTLMKIGIGIKLPCKPNTNNLNFTSESMECFEKHLLNTYDYGCFGVSLSSIEGINICGVIGIMFDIENYDKFDIKSLIRFLTIKANQTIKNKS